MPDPYHQRAQRSQTVHSDACRHTLALSHNGLLAIAIHICGVFSRVLVREARPEALRRHPAFRQRSEPRSAASARTKAVAAILVPSMLSLARLGLADLRDASPQS